MNIPLVMITMAAEYTCIHEEQIQGQSRAIERLDAELSYKKERLDDLKEDNRRMEGKIDELSKDISDFISESDSKDSALNERLIKIETRQEVQDEATKKNRDDFKLWLSILSIVFIGLTFYFNFMR